MSPYIVTVKEPSYDATADHRVSLERRRKAIAARQFKVLSRVVVGSLEEAKDALAEVEHAAGLATAPHAEALDEFGGSADLSDGTRIEVQATTWERLARDLDPPEEWGLDYPTWGDEDLLNSWNMEHGSRTS